MRLRLATFNLENLDDDPGAEPAFALRLAVLRPALDRLDADILCLQEVNAREQPDRPRDVGALDRLLEGTGMAGWHRATTTNDAGTAPRDVHNLVVLSRFPILAARQVMHGRVPPLAWRRLAAEPPDTEPVPIRFERPLLHVRIDLGRPRPLDVVNLHLRAPRAASIPGQKAAAHIWSSVAGWAEGFFLSAMQRVGQALDARLLVEDLLDADPGAWVALVGDFNAEGRETPLALLRADVEATGNGDLDARSLVSLDRILPADDRFTVLHGGRPLMLDHVLVSRGLARLARAAETHNETLADELAAFRAGLDDPAGYHAPLVVTFHIPDGDRPDREAR